MVICAVVLLAVGAFRSVSSQTGRPPPAPHPTTTTVPTVAGPYIIDAGQAESLGGDHGS
jgi:hypothetical protein